jgi:hypothetical protein
MFIRRGGPIPKIPTPVWETEWFRLDFERGVVSSYFSLMSGPKVTYLKAR